MKERKENSVCGNVDGAAENSAAQKREIVRGTAENGALQDAACAAEGSALVKTQNAPAALSGKERAVQAVKFVFFSASAGVIQLGSFTLMNEIFKWNYWVCYLVALVLSVVWNFTLNREFTFKSAANVPVAMLKVFAFYAVFTPLSTWGGEAVTDAGVNEYIIVGVTMVLNMVLEFLYCTFLVYRNSMNTKKKRNTVKDGK